MRGDNAGNMTGSGMYDRQTEPMMNIELARILQHDRERDIEAHLRIRRLLRPADATDSGRDVSKAVGRPQRPATGSAVCR